MLINRIQLAAMDRASIPESERRDFYLYVDEFQNFATESFATILSEARKYRLNLTVAHQYITQMEEPVRDAVFGNVGTIVTFRVGAFDAEYLEKEFFPTFTQTHLVNLDKYNAYIKLMINGITSKPFSMQTIPPNIENFVKRATVLSVSRERYGRKREIVEEKIARWSGVALQGNAEIVPAEPIERGRRGDQRRSDRPRAHEERRAPRQVPPVTPKFIEKELEDVVVGAVKNEITDLAAALKAEEAKAPTDPRQAKKMYPAVCDRCGKATQVPFEPDPEKKVYCDECFAIIKEERRQQKEQTGRAQTQVSKSVPTRKSAVVPPKGKSGQVFAGPTPPPPR
jgi:CxxC-x17-CxxC domain-containing protein